MLPIPSKGADHFYVLNFRHFFSSSQSVHSSGNDCCEGTHKSNTDLRLVSYCCLYILTHGCRRITCWCSVGNEPEEDSLKGNHKGWVCLGSFPFSSPAYETSKITLSVAATHFLSGLVGKSPNTLSRASSRKVRIRVAFVL